MNVISERCDFKIGDCIAERYAIEKTLGEGSFGKVFRVKDRKSGDMYALKLFKFWELPPAQREEMTSRFQMEYETGQVKSNYLVHSKESGYIKGNPYIVMEFCPFGDLQYFVDNHQSTDFVKIGKEILYGLKDLHGCGKVHRDLKPENVLIKSNGVAALTDFGISGDRAKRLTAIDFFGKPTVMGTIPYMAPEQAKPKNREVTVLPTMDIFAFGVMMYFLITNRFPFGELNNENDMVLYLRRAREENWNKDFLINHPDGKKFDKVISGCLKSDYQKRLKTVDAVLSLLPQVKDFSYDNSNNTFQKQIIHGVLLRIMQGEEYGKGYKLNELLRGKSRIITIGCNDPSVNNSLQITEKFSRYVSRKHCTLELSFNNQWVIRDGQWDRDATNMWKRSLNGTYVNSTEVSQDGMSINPGDIITIGDVKLRLEGY